MPFGRCPVCGASYHLSVSLPVDEWYRRHWPGVPFGAEVPGECLRCWVLLRVGHQVTVRAVPEPLAGTVGVGAAGVVVAVEQEGAEPVFAVELSGAAIPVGHFHRRELFWGWVSRPSGRPQTPPNELSMPTDSNKS